MCGLVGTASSERMKDRSLRGDFMTQGLYIDSIRGWESTGIACVHHKDMRGNPTVFKRALSGGDFVQQRRYDKLIKDADEHAVIIGHNRAATRGDVNDDNAHPFQYGHITLVHNGHISNHWDLPNVREAGAEVDSAHVAYAMAKNGEMETLEAVDGGFTFVWWNANTETLNIARNDKRPLYLCYLEKANSMFWASEDWMLAGLLLRLNASIDTDIGLKFPNPMVWHKFKLDDLRKVEKVPFVKRHAALSGQRGITVTGPVGLPSQRKNWDTQDEYEAMMGTSATSSTGLTTTSETSDGDEVSEIRRSLRNQRAKDARYAGRPTSKKRIETATVALRQLGIRFEEARICKPCHWSRYKNQREFGSILAKCGKDGRYVEVIGCTFKQYDYAYQRATMAVKICNVRKKGDGAVVLVGYLHPASPVLNPSVSLPDRVAAEVDAMDDPVPEFNHRGPGGTMVTLEKFKELTKECCGNCGGWINPMFHERTVWVGSPASALCHVCSGDETILRDLGITIERRFDTDDKVARVH